VQWGAPIRSVRERSGAVFKSNDCLAIPQSLAGWLSDSPPESDELNLAVAVAVTKNAVYTRARAESVGAPHCIAHGVREEEQDDAEGRQV
jgi:hypothetical protein